VGFTKTINQIVFGVS
jgi:MFS family permease